MEQLNFNGQTKTEIAIDFLKEHEPPEGYFLGFSGGKDSTVLLDVARRSGVKFQAFYSCTGVDPPELTRFIRKEHPDVKWLFPKQSFYKEIVKRNFPTKFSRWCCDFLKKDPSKKIPLSHRLMGIRAEESFKRKQRGEIDILTKKNIHYKPIFHWLEWEIWEYIERLKLPYCSLYDEGFDRIGCVICPFMSYKKHQIAKKRWPGHYKAFEKAMLELWDDREWWRQTRGRYSMLPEEFIDNWYKSI